MRKLYQSVLNALPILLILAACKTGQTGEIVIRDAWARPTVGTTSAPTKSMDSSGMAVTQTMGAAPAMDGPVSAAYFVIDNKTGTVDRLVGVTSSVAEVTEVHETKQMDNGMMGMQPVMGGLEIPANGSVTLKPGGYHVMMMKLRQDLQVGQMIKLTLNFQSGKQMTIDVPVKPAQ